MSDVKFIVNLPPANAGVIRHLLPFINLVSTSRERALGLKLLGFTSTEEYIMAVSQDRSHSEMLSVLLLLFQMDDFEEKKGFFDCITFYDKRLEREVSELVGLDKDIISVKELEDMWEVKFPMDEWWDTDLS